MTSYLDARNAILGLLPDLNGWQVYKDGIANGSKPPWVVVSLSEKWRDGSEAGSTSSHRATLSIRVVSTSESSIGGACDRLMHALDGAQPGSGIAGLLADADSGVYASELVNPDTSTPYLMRVLSWRTGWPD
jgi:hypothetical protein